MQILVHRLREALGLLGPVVPKKHTLPVLTSILLGNGRAVATDLETTIAVELPEAEGQCTMPFRETADLLKYVPADKLLAVEQKGEKLELAWPGGRASYKTHDPEDYPPLPEVKARVEQAVDGDTLVPVLLVVAEYCATDSSRPVLTGVALTLGESVEVAAGDGFRMAYQTLPISFPPGEGTDRVILPAKAIRILGHLWKRAPRTAPAADSLVQLVTARRQLVLALGDGLLEARFGSVCMIAKLIEGSPPNFRQLIPQDAPHKVRALAPDFERALRQVREVAKDSYGTVRLIWSEAEMTVQAKGKEKGEVETAFSVETEGGPGRIAVNCSYMLDYLRSKEGLVAMGVRGPLDPILFRYGASPLVLIMPMFVQW